VFIAYSGTYGETVARFVDHCLWRHRIRPCIALPRTHGEIPVDNEEGILKEESGCKLTLAIVTEGAVDSPEFQKEVGMAHRSFRIPVIVLLQGASRNMLILQEDPHVRFRRGRHSEKCQEIVNWVRAVLARSVQSSSAPLNTRFRRRTVG
jgi:hypothetical protein